MGNGNERNDIKLKILGEDWDLVFKERKDDELLSKNDGYCDYTSRKIVIAYFDGNLDDEDKYMAQVIRHEIIHAFASESGLAGNWQHPEFGHDETMVDWFAIQYPKMKTVFDELNV